MARKKSTIRKRGTRKRPIETYEHKDKKRINNPPVGLVTPETDPDAVKKKTYAYDPHLDPQLVWAGKAEHTSFEVPTVSLHVHERIDPRTIVEAVRKRNGDLDSGQLPLFSTPEENPPLRNAIEFYKHAHGWSPQRVVASFGPENAPLEQRQGAHAIEEAQTLVPKPKLIVFAAFQFDSEAAKDIDETNWPGVRLLKAQMNADLLTDDLKKKRASNESFWLIGQPDAHVETIGKGDDKGKRRVVVAGFDYYNTKTGNIESGGKDRIAVWMLDTDYDGRSLYPRQVFFPMAGDKEGWSRLAKNLKAEIDEELIQAYRGTKSLPFEPGEHKRVAVKIVDDRGIESLKIMELE